jgi:Ca-activated chloride channel family protein
MVIVCCLLMPSRPVLADEESSKTLSPYFFVENGDEDAERFPLKGTSVKAVINGVIADVHITQRYANLGSQPINGRYVFPASTRAAVHGMRMTVGEDVVVAQIQERQAAKKVFETAKSAGQSASLLEQQRPNVFSMDIANIMPGEEITIELHYSEHLVPDDGTYAFVYPTVVGPRYSTIPEAGADDHHLYVQNPYLTSEQKPTNRFDMQIVLAAGLPLQQVACTTHAVHVAWDSEARARIVLAESETHGGDRDFILNYRLSGDQIHSGLLLHNGEEEKFFTLMVQPPERVTPDAIPAREYIFVVDVSGSMHGFPLETAKVLLQQLIGSLRPSDTFNVILFSGAANVLAPQSLPADPSNIQSALRHIDRQQGGGGTELYQAVQKGLALPRDEGRSRTMVVITDGYIAAEKKVFGLIADNLNRNNLFAFGIGSGVNRYLIEGLARAGQGEPFVITEPHAAAAAARQFQDYIQAPLLTGIAVEFEGFEAYDVEPKVTADLFAARPLVICGKWRGRPEGAIVIKGFTGQGPYEKRFEVSSHLDSQNTDALPYLWARMRLARLTDFASPDDDDDTRKAVTQLGLDHNLLTAYTSFVAVHEQVRNTGGPAKDVEQPLPLPRGVSNLAVGGRNVPEPELGVLLSLLLVGSLLWGWRQRLTTQAAADRSRKG